MKTQLMPINLNNYIININEPLGTGLSSMVNNLLKKVFQAKNIDTNNYVALKLFNKYTYDNSLQQQMISKMYQIEVEVLKQCNKLNNKNIVRLIQNFENSNQYALILELCDYSLMEYLQNQSFIKEEYALDIFLQIYNGLSCLQNYKFYHRDIKPSNIMFKDNQIKIIDFGFCKQIKNLENQQIHTRCGTNGYEAPEVKMGYYDPEKSDIYSLGVVYYEILYGLQNFKNLKEFTYPTEIMVSERTQTLIDMMVQDDYRNRISWKQIGDILKAIKSTSKIEYHKQFQLDENLKQKFYIFQKILKDFQKLREQIKDFSSQTLELLLIKKMIFDFEITKLQFEKQKLQLERELKLLQDSQNVHILELQILQNHSQRIKLHKLISNLESERQRSLNENKELKLKLCNNYFIQHFNYLNEELFNEQSENFKQNLEREINQLFQLLQKSEFINNENQLQIKLLKINILLIKYSDNNFVKMNYYNNRNKLRINYTQYLFQNQLYLFLINIKIIVNKQQINQYN